MNCQATTATVVVTNSFFVQSFSLAAPDDKGSFIPDYCDSEFVRASNMVIVTNGNFSNVGQKRAIKVNSPVNVMNTDGEIILCLIINEFGVNYFIPHDSNKIRSSAEPKEILYTIPVTFLGSRPEDQGQLVEFQVIGLDGGCEDGPIVLPIKKLENKLQYCCRDLTFQQSAQEENVQHNQTRNIIDSGSIPAFLQNIPEDLELKNCALELSDLNDNSLPELVDLDLELFDQYASNNTGDQKETQIFNQSSTESQNPKSDENSSSNYSTNNNNELNEVRWMNAYNEILDHFVNFVKNNRDHCESTVNGAVNNQETVDDVFELTGLDSDNNNAGTLNEDLLLYDHHVDSNMSGQEESQKDKFIVQNEQVDSGNIMYSPMVFSSTMDNSNEFDDILSMSIDNVTFEHFLRLPNNNNKPFDVQKGDNGNCMTYKDISSQRFDYVCEICGITFEDEKLFTRHKNNHNVERKFICKICNKGFKRNDHLKNHITYTHQKVKKNNCRFCGKRFKRLFDLKTHAKKYHSHLLTLCSSTGDNN